MKKEQGDLKGKVIASDYKFLTEIVGKTNSHIKIKQKHGLPFVVFKYKKRMGFLAGGLVFSAIICLFSSYVWNVNVIGNDTIPTQEILKTMEELGVSPGSLKHRINVPMAEQMAMMKLGGVAWMSLNVNGSCVNVLIKEKIKTPEIYSEGEPCNVVACEDGQIERLETYRGTPLISVGDVVTKGQLLISGVSESATSKNLFLNADGKVFAKTQRKIKETIKLSSLKAMDTGKSVKRYRIKILGLEIPIGLWQKIDDNFRSEVSLNSLKIFGVELPVKIHKEIWHEQECNEIILTPEEAKLEAEKTISERENSEFGSVQVMDRTIDSREENGEYTVEVKLVCVEDIGKKEHISFN